ncbi:lantibiotic dehydratase, partial [Streptosporangium sp. NPDC001682]
MKSWPDLIGDSGGITTWRPWLEQTLTLPGFADALEQASPVLTRRVREICAGRDDLPELKQRRVVLSLLRYRLRASGRATPFGLFAGVAAARVADTAKVHIGDRHQPLARAEAGWLTSLIRELEADAQLRPHLRVRANNMIIERDGLLVLEHCPAEAATSAPVTVSVRATAPIRAALRLAREPIRWADLADKLVTDIPGGSAEAADRLLTRMVAQQLLLTSLRPAMTESDPLAHLIKQLRAAPGNGASKVADTRPDVAVDLRVDWDMRIPHAVAAEAATAASVLVRLARLPYLSSGWVNWHGRFLERYGPRALVPVLDVVDADTGLGYPAGYLGSTAAVATGALTDRDRRLLALAQWAALRGQREIVLDDATLTDLALGEGTAATQPTTELTVHIAAATQQALTRGDFTLTVLGVSRAAGTSVGRFLPLLDANDRERTRSVYASLPTVVRGALPVQVSAPPLHISTQNVARAPRVLGHVLPLGEFHHGGGDVIALEDLAVTADRNHLYLASLSRRQVVAPMLFNAVGLGHHTHPLVRFLIEVGTALTTPCTEFNWGAAAALPFLPALRYERTILAPARWRLTADDLPGPAATWQAWQDALAVWRQQMGIPARVGLTEGDRVLHLDLDVPAHRVLLRAHLDRTATAVLVTSPAPDAEGWAGGQVAEVVIPLAVTSTPPPAPTWLATTSATARDHGYPPGRNGRFFLKLYGHPDRQTAILTRHLPYLHAELAELGVGGRSWFLRYHDPDCHLRLRVTVPADSFAATADCLAAWSERLRQANLGRARLTGLYDVEPLVAQPDRQQPG